MYDPRGVDGRDDLQDVTQPMPSVALYAGEVHPLRRIAARALGNIANRLAGISGGEPSSADDGAHAELPEANSGTSADASDDIYDPVIAAKLGRFTGYDPRLGTRQYQESHPNTDAQPAGLSWWEKYKNFSATTSSVGPGAHNLVPAQPGDARQSQQSTTQEPPIENPAVSYGDTGSSLGLTNGVGAHGESAGLPQWQGVLHNPMAKTPQSTTGETEGEEETDDGEQQAAERARRITDELNLLLARPTNSTELVRQLKALGESEDPDAENQRREIIARLGDHVALKAAIDAVIISVEPPAPQWKLLRLRQAVAEHATRSMLAGDSRSEDGDTYRQFYTDNLPDEDGEAQD